MEARKRLLLLDSEDDVKIVLEVAPEEVTLEEPAPDSARSRRQSPSSRTLSHYWKQDLC